MSLRSTTFGNDVPSLSPSQSRRPAWRRRLIDLERGVMIGFRASGVVVVHLFCGLIGLAAGLVIGLSLREWLLLVLCFTLSLAMELMHRAVVLVCRSLPEGPNGSRQAECASSAAATLIMSGSILISVVTICARAYSFWD